MAVESKSTRSCNHRNKRCKTPPTWLDWPSFDATPRRKSKGEHTPGSFCRKSKFQKWLSKVNFSARRTCTFATFSLIGSRKWFAQNRPRSGRICVLQFVVLQLLQLRHHCESIVVRLPRVDWQSHGTALEPGLRVTGHRVTGSTTGRVGSGHGSVWQTRRLTRFCGSFTRFAVAFGERIRHLGIWETANLAIFFYFAIYNKFTIYSVETFRHLYACCTDQKLSAESIHH